MEASNNMSASRVSATYPCQVARNVGADGIAVAAFGDAAVFDGSEIELIFKVGAWGLTYTWGLEGAKAATLFVGAGWWCLIPEPWYDDLICETVC